MGAIVTGREGVARKNVGKTGGIKNVDAKGLIAIRMPKGNGDSSYIDAYTAPYVEGAHGRCGLDATVQPIPGDDNNVMVIFKKETRDKYEKQCDEETARLRKIGNANRSTKVGAGGVNNETATEVITTAGSLAGPG
jgi:hypothetical protein